MGFTICLACKSLYYPEGAGHMWVRLNWALGLKALGCRVIWLEKIKNDQHISLEKTLESVQILKSRLESFGFHNSLALYPWIDEKLPVELTEFTLSLDEAMNADLLINLQYNLPDHIIKKVKRSALIDIDPGLTQSFLADKKLDLAKHDFYFSIGETAGKANACFPSAGISWIYTPPCVAIDAWQPTKSRDSAPFTTISHWNANEWIVLEDGTMYSNDKRDGFLPYVDLPKQTQTKLELAICLNGDETEKTFLEEKGWIVRESWDVSNTLSSYKAYVDNSKGEFSCVKPHYRIMQTAWISDRSLCYLAAGKPVIMENTGPSGFLPDFAGLLRFRNFEEAVKCIDEAQKNYDRHCRLARQLAEEYFDAKKVAKNFLEYVL